MNFNFKFKDAIYLVIIILLIIGFIKVLGNKIEQLHNIQNNFEEKAQQDSIEYVKLDKYYTDKLELYQSRIDSLREKLDIKPEHIENVVETVVHDIDTVRDTIKIQEPPPDYEWEFFKSKTECFEIEGYSPCDLMITCREYRDTLTIFKYKRRRRLFGWKWTPHWGKFEEDFKTHSKCGDIKVKWMERVK